jgi:hypothetical protein
MRRFVPGVDSYLGAGVPASLMRFSESDSGEGASRNPSYIGDVELIPERPASLIERYRQLCYWRQVIHAEYN